MKLFRSASIAVLIALAASGCARQESEDATAASETAAAAPAAKPLNLPPPEITPVTVQVTLSPKAEAELKKTGETIVLEATYGGDPKPESESKANELGLIELGKKKLELKGAETVTFAEDVIDKSRLGLILGQPQIMLNAVSGKKSSPQNILGCKFYWDTLATAGKATVQLPCKLLSEGAPAE